MGGAWRIGVNSRGDLSVDMRDFFANFFLRSRKIGRGKQKNEKGNKGSLF